MVTFINSCLKKEPLFLACPDGRLQGQGRKPRLPAFGFMKLQSCVGLVDSFSNPLCSPVTPFQLAFVSATEGGCEGRGRGCPSSHCKRRLLGMGENTLASGSGAVSARKLQLQAIEAGLD